jgi:hypothetical protein
MVIIDYLTLWELIAAGEPIPSTNKAGYYGVSRYKFRNSGFEGFQVKSPCVSYVFTMYFASK